MVHTSAAVPESIDAEGPRPDARGRLGIEGSRPKPTKPGLSHRHLSLHWGTVAHRRWPFPHRRAQAQLRALCSLARLLRRVKARHPQEQRSLGLPARIPRRSSQRLGADAQRWGARRCAPRRHRRAVRRLAGFKGRQSWRRASSRPDPCRRTRGAAADHAGWDTHVRYVYRTAARDARSRRRARPPAAMEDAPAAVGHAGTPG